jgi:DNA-binding GntR family transcriptional regulator
MVRRVTETGDGSIERLSTSDWAFQQIREAIFAGKFKPGDRLRELHLARSLQVGQSSIREALLQLERAGLVVKEPHRGTRVRQLTAQESNERLAIRAVLEPLAFEQAARHVSDQVTGRLRKQLERIQEAELAHNEYELSQADFDFHRTIWQLSNNTTLSRILEQLTAPLFSSIALIRHFDDTHAGDYYRAHNELLQSLLSADPDTARQAIARHMDAQLKFFREQAQAATHPSAS